MAMRSTKVFLDLPIGAEFGAVAFGEVAEIGGAFAREDGAFARKSVDGAVEAGARFASAVRGPVDFSEFLRLEFVSDSVDVCLSAIRVRLDGGWAGDLVHGGEGNGEYVWSMCDQSGRTGQDACPTVV
jgi:hypothetical protein